MATFTRVRCPEIGRKDNGLLMTPEDQIVSETETYRTLLLPGFELSLAELLQVCDDWHR